MKKKETENRFKFDLKHILQYSKEGVMQMVVLYTLEATD